MSPLPDPSAPGVSPEAFPAPAPGHLPSVARLAAYLRRCRAEDRPARLVFVCTHNSRRSQLAQVWAWHLGHAAGLAVEAHSAGTEATAVADPVPPALERAGFGTERLDAGPRPGWRVRAGARHLDLWSKTLTDPALPGEGFAAVMVCSDADANCPFVPGAEERIPLPFDDPKARDRQPDEADAYDAASRRIAGTLRAALDAARGPV